MKTIGRMCALALAAVSLPAAAADEEGARSRWAFGVALGYGVRTNPLASSDDVPVVVDLDIAWFGERFFFDNGDFGMTFADNDALTASLVLRLNSDRVFFSRTDTRLVTVDLAGVPLAEAVPLVIPERDYAAELGIELLADGDWGRLQATAHHDVGGTHDGFEVRLDYGYGWRKQRWYVEPSIGLSFKSDAMNDYYWGVRENESSAVLPAYRAGSGVNVHGRLLFSYQLSRRWALALVVDAERLNDDAAASPIVADDAVLGYFGGFGYRF